jgi:type II secretory pathway pseudopilin PulG
LVVVILVIAALAALLVPAAQRTLDRAKSAQAKNDVTQIVTAVNAYYTEYGKYPIATTDTPLNTTQTGDLFYTLRAVDPGSGANAGNAANPRRIVFLSPRIANSLTAPRNGVAQQNVTVGATVTIAAGSLVDPWGTAYKIAMDGDYDNQIQNNPYGNNNGAGPQPLPQTVIAWSFGKDGTPGKNGNNIFTGSDDIISWQ